MNHQPCQPRQKARHLELPRLHHGPAAPDCRHHPFVNVLKIIARATVQIAANRLRDETPLLHRHGCESWQRLLAKAHAEKADAWLGFELSFTEKTLAAPETKSEFADIETWRGLPVQSLLTPYTEIRWMLSLLSLRPGETACDLGCAYGRMAFVMHRHTPQNHFVGYEIEEARVIEGNRVLAKYLDRFPAPVGTIGRQVLLHQDLTAEDFILPDAAAYFIYDFGSAAAIEGILQKLKARARERSIQVIGRGRRTRALIHANHPWLCEVNPAKHTENFSVYRS